MSGDNIPFSVREGFAARTLGMGDSDVLHKIWSAIYDFVMYEDAQQARMKVFAARASVIARDRMAFKENQASPHTTLENTDELALTGARESLEREWLNARGDSWFKFYDLCEFLVAESPNGAEIAAAIQGELDRMGNVGCRLFDGKFVPVHSPEEAKEVERAVAAPFPAARTHMQNAIAAFADRERPDYANAVKEAIHAAASVARELTGEKKVGAAVDKLHRDGVLPHGAFAKALKSHYGFASDAGGIRHEAVGGLLEPDAETARFLLVTCAAFVNYMTARKDSRKTGGD